MSITETTTRITRQYLRNKTKEDIIDLLMMVLDQQVEPIALLEKVKNEIPDAHFPELGCSPHKVIDEIIAEYS